MDRCLICGEPATIFPDKGTRDVYEVTCHNRCGEYFITRTASVNLKNTELSLRQITNISGWLCENPRYEIDSKNLEKLLQLKSPSFHEKADKILLSFEKITSYAGDSIEKKPKLISLGWCANDDEFSEIINFLKTTQRIQENEGRPHTFYKILPDGWAHLENLKKVNIDSVQCFVAMWFSDEMKTIYDSTIAPAIIAAGYKPHRVDLREHNEKIDDEIIAQIRRSRFVLADYTGHRGGVYFEAGFAKGLNLEVIWTCREDHVDDLHFDIRQYNCIVWNQENLKDFQKRITNRIEAVLGHGNYQ